MDEATFKKLREQLDDVWPIFDQFNHRHGFAYVPDIGRYPRIRVERRVTAEHVVWLEFWMCLDENGRYREQSDDETPYELSGGVSVDVSQQGGTTSHYLSHAIYKDRPLRLATPTLADDLEALREHVTSWSRADVLAHGRKVDL